MCSRQEHFPETAAALSWADSATRAEKKSRETFNFSREMEIIFIIISELLKIP